MMVRIIILMAILCVISPYKYDHEFVCIEKVYKKPSLKKSIKRIAKEIGVSESLLLAITELESNFDIKCKNKNSTAFGAFQFLEPTGKWVSKKLGYTEYSHYESTEEVQLEMFKWYISYLNKKYRGDEKKIIKEYSGGTHYYWKRLTEIRKKYKED